MIITYVVLGYPSVSETKKLVNTMVASGVKKIELQIPFSDPIADGPVITHANEVALQNGMTVETAFECAKGIISAFSSVEFYFMTYGNIIYNYGIEDFCTQAGEIGIRGIIAPDIPYDTREGEMLYSACVENNISLVSVISPNILPAVEEKIIALSTDFIYLTSTKGSTGQRDFLDDGFKEVIKRIKDKTNCPVAIGFGISSKEHVTEVLEVADYAIIGSHFLKKYESDGISGVEEELEKLFMNKGACSLVHEYLSRL